MKTTTHKNSNTLLKSAKRHLNQGVSLALIRQGKGAWREDSKTRLDEIALMQTALNNRGFSTGKPDGYYGKNTVQGVKGFQQSQGLTADGVFGKRTLYALEQQVGKLGGEDLSEPSLPNDNLPQKEKLIYHRQNDYLLPKQREDNARYIYAYLSNENYNPRSICAILGNMDAESGLNPGLWERRRANNLNGGFGLTQWTPSTKIIEYAQKHGKAMDDMDIQLKRFCEEMQGIVGENEKQQWVPQYVGKLTGDDFKTNAQKKTIEELTVLFVKGYERPPKPDYVERKRRARKWAKFFGVQ